MKGYSTNQRLNDMEYRMNNRFFQIEKTIAEHDAKIDFFVRTSLPPVEGIFFDGQIFDAYKFATDLIKSAKCSLVLIDNYVDAVSYTHLAFYHLIYPFHTYNILCNCPIPRGSYGYTH